MYYLLYFMPNKSKSTRPKGRKTKRASNGNRGAKAPTAGGRRPATDMLKLIPIFPQSKLVKGMLYYEASISLAGTSGAASTYTFSCNDAFDPNHTGSGHQPMGFDQMMSVYDQFTVVGSSITVQFAPAIASVITRVGLSLKDASASVTNITQLMENGLSEMALCVGAKQPGQHCAPTLTMHCDVQKFFGIIRRDDFLQNPNFLGNASTSPLEQCYFQITAWDLMLSETYSIAADVLVSYDVYFWEPKKETTSVFSPMSKQDRVMRRVRALEEEKKR